MGVVDNAVEDGIGQGGLPTISYQWSTGTWPVMISERAL